MSKREEPGSTISPATLSRGLYSQRGFRHKGWIATDIEDRGEPDEICEACQRQQVRYVHILHHSDDSEANNFGRLEAGCVCAGFLTEDYEGAAASERRVRNETARKTRAAKRELEKQERLRAAEGFRKASEARRRLDFSKSWVRDPTKPTTTRQGAFTVFRNRFGYGVRCKNRGFVVGSFSKEEEAQAYALAIEFKDVSPEYETRS